MYQKVPTLSLFLGPQAKDWQALCSTGIPLLYGVMAKRSEAAQSVNQCRLLLHHSNLTTGISALQPGT